MLRLCGAIFFRQCRGGWTARWRTGAQIQTRFVKPVLKCALARALAETSTSVPHMRDTGSWSRALSLHRTVGHSDRSCHRSFDRTRYPRSEPPSAYAENMARRAHRLGSRNEICVSEIVRVVRGPCDRRWSRMSRCRVAKHR